ncbi:MAG: HEAT repeat domain-containing protein, partial [Candidatus Nealsonbacteria bacterium]|nr:HEAT repeat domain-containing protein [Candidatus Nealsonbacteria bacterium]
GGTASPAAGGTASPAVGGTGEQRELKRPGAVRVRITAGLEEAVRKFHQHQQPEVVEALLLVAKQTNASLRRLLQSPGDAAHQAIRDVMANSSSGGVIRLLLGFMEDARMPTTVLSAISNRRDEKFVGHLLRKIGPRPSSAVAETLRRFTEIAWAQPEDPLFAELDEEAQQGAVGMLVHSSADRAHVLEMLGYLLSEGNPGGRRAAAAALADFPGPEANRMVVMALNDEDPQVRAHLIPQLRQRKIPGVFSLLVHMIDTDDESVLKALRKAMPEFSLEQFMANYDGMDEKLRPMAAQVVKQIDRGVRKKIAAILEGPSPVRRRRAIGAATEMGLVDGMESVIAGLLSDDDHMVRVMAARALADSKSVPSWEALRDAMFDRSILVKEAAEKSLESISDWLTQHAEETEDQPQETSA